MPHFFHHGLRNVIVVETKVKNRRGAESFVDVMLNSAGIVGDGGVGMEARVADPGECAAPAETRRRQPCARHVREDTEWLRQCPPVFDRAECAAPIACPAWLPLDRRLTRRRAGRGRTVLAQWPDIQRGRKRSATDWMCAVHPENFLQNNNAGFRFAAGLCDVGIKFVAIGGLQLCVLRHFESPLCNGDAIATGRLRVSRSGFRTRYVWRVRD